MTPKPTAPAALSWSGVTARRMARHGQPRERLYPGPAATRALSPARWLAITVEPLGELTAARRRQLEDEVELVGTVMEAKATLTVGTVTVGPHA